MTSLTRSVRTGRERPDLLHRPVRLPTVGRHTIRGKQSGRPRPLRRGVGMHSSAPACTRVCGNSTCNPQLQGIYRADASSTSRPSAVRRCPGLGGLLAWADGSRDGCRDADEVPRGVQACGGRGRSHQRVEPRQVAREFGISTHSVQRWLKQADLEDGLTEGTSSDDQDELAKLRRCDPVLDRRSRSCGGPRRASPRTRPQDDLPAGP
jgi:hypothetical protein